MQEIREFFLNLNLFNDFTVEEIFTLSNYLSSYFFSAQQVLMSQGEVGDYFGIILSGEVSIVDNGRIIATRKPGDFVGEMALIRAGTRIASVIAATDIQIAIMPFDNFENLKKSHSEIAIKLISILTESTFNKLHKTELLLRVEREKSEALLLNVLPQVIAERLKQKQQFIAEYFKEVTVLFADIVNFTPLASQISPLELVNLLDEIFSKFDQLTEKNGLEKIKTIGDAYMVVGGVPVPKEAHAEAIANMALDMRETLDSFESPLIKPLKIRIGIHSGAVVAGVIGLKKFSYDLWGDAVNIASRMESSGLPGQIQVSAVTYELLKNKYLFEKRGHILVKGKGEMTTYWLIKSLMNDR